ncbi:hypothetical protein QYF36_007907 [Acer negundo]|nr:hypothetical protein QYF36_026669 [Acer negundo]KAK4850570.1 hypothetical protein QYF36_007907 [Acer negundo]
MLGGMIWMEKQRWDAVWEKLAWRAMLVNKLSVLEIALVDFMMASFVGCALGLSGAAGEIASKAKVLGKQRQWVVYKGKQSSGLYVLCGLLD